MHLSDLTEAESVWLKNSRKSSWECKNWSKYRHLASYTSMESSDVPSTTKIKYNRPTATIFFLIFVCLMGCLALLLFDNLANENNESPPPQSLGKCPQKFYIDSENGILWSQDAEATLPVGFGSIKRKVWREGLSSMNNGPLVVHMRPDTCGRMQNREIILSDASHLCLRYRINKDQIQGEMYARQLASELGLEGRHLPPSALWRLNLTGEEWSRVRPEVDLAGWTNEALVVVTRFEGGLQDVKIPVQLRSVLPSTDHQLNGIHPSLIDNLTRHEVSQLMQWSDLLIFDYLTANQDRFVSSLINHQWNSKIMTYPAHNLASLSSSHHLVFLDHEAAFFHGYRLLGRYDHLHRNVLSRVCIFRRETLAAIRRLAGHRDLEHLLTNGIRDVEGHSADYLPPLTNHNARILKNRLEDVITHAKNCQMKNLIRKC